MPRSHAACAAAALVAACLLAPARAAETNVTLFVIERSKNANIVCYDACLTAEGTLHPKEPVKAYWIMRAEDGRREGLNMVERAKAYGFDIRPDASGKHWVMTLAAYRKREIAVRAVPGGARAEMVIDGRTAIFDKLYINSTDGRLLPRVNYLEFFGRDLETGEKRYEKFIPE